MSRFGNILTQPPIDIDGFRRHPQAHQDEDKPERSRMVDGTEYMTVSEWLRRLDPFQYPQVSELISASGYDRTYVVLGKLAADQGRLMRVEPVKLYHPEYESVNGWPASIIEAAWSKFKSRYYNSLRWLDRDPEIPPTPEPYEMPPVAISPGLMGQIRHAVERRGVALSHTADPRWRGAFAVMLEERPGESPQQALVRRTSAAGAMFAIEKEYEGR